MCSYLQDALKCIRYTEEDLITKKNLSMEDIETLLY